MENLKCISYIVFFHALEIARCIGLRFTGWWTMPLGRFSIIEIKRMFANLFRLSFRYVFCELLGKQNTYAMIFVYPLPKAIHNREYEVAYAW